MTEATPVDLLDKPTNGYDNLRPRDTLEETVHLMSVFFPDPQDRNRQTQLGVHFEEVAEMIETLSPTTELSARLLEEAHRAVEALATHMKNEAPGAIFLPLGRATDFLDSVADQLVTVTGVAYVHNMNPVGALSEVNRSNRSKLGEDGLPIFVEGTGKWAKGPNYTAPDLSPYLLR